MSFSMNELNVVANTLVSLYENGGLRSDLVDTCNFVENQAGFPAGTLLQVVIELRRRPKVSKVGDFTKVEYNDKIYYYDDVMSICTKFTVEFMNSKPAVASALVIINPKDNSIEKCKFVDLSYVFDVYFGTDK